MIEAAGHLKLVLYISLIICLFLPFGMAPVAADLSAWAIGLAALSRQGLRRGYSAGSLGGKHRENAGFPRQRVSSVERFVFSFLAILLAFLSREVLR